ncbi:MAG: pyridoxine 5'-phosphate synthase [Acidobacteria bacterium]|nr:pyridoxine 5'-phosphate synthase [Acidobacteriota bacterium]
MRLAVNIDHIATIREARKAREPQPLAAALIAERAGAHGITVHLRTDRRHIQDRDLEALRQGIATKLNVEMAVTDEMANIALKVRPDQVTLVPERPRELTTEGGLDVVQSADAVKRFTGRLRDAGIAVSIFLDAELRQVEAAQVAGAGAIEINTGRYAEAPAPDVKIELDRIAVAARAGAAAGLEVLAGHGLDYVNVKPIVGVPEIVELNIGHSIVARAALAGMETAVRDMVELLRR